MIDGHMEVVPSDEQLTRFKDAVTDAVLWLEGFTQNGGEYSGDWNSLKTAQEWLRSEELARKAQKKGSEK